MPFEEYGYWLSNFILYWILAPFALVGYVLWMVIVEPWQDRRDSREKAGKSPTPADWIARGFWAALPWAVGGLVALFDAFVVAMFIYAIFFAPD